MKFWPFLGPSFGPFFRPPWVPLLRPLFLQLFQEKFPKKWPKKWPKKCPKNGQKCLYLLIIAFQTPKNPIFLPLYQPLWYRGDFFFFAKMCTFWYLKNRKFFTWRKFRSKPRCKKIVTGGGVVQVGKKRAPQGLFLRNFTPQTGVWELIRTNFCSSEEHFFACRKFCKKFRKKFDKNFMIFWQKNPPQGDLFLMIFLVLSGGHF